MTSLVVSLTAYSFKEKIQLGKGFETTQTKQQLALFLIKNSTIIEMEDL